MNLIELFEKAERLYTKDRESQCMLGYMPSIRRHTALLFKLNYDVMGTRPGDGTINTIHDFVHSFNRQNENVPFDINPADAFGGWPRDSFESWIQQAHTRFRFRGHVRQNNKSMHCGTTIVFDVSGVIDQDLNEYISEYDQASIMRKLET